MLCVDRLLVGRVAANGASRAATARCSDRCEITKSSDLVVVSTFPSAADAQIAKGVLDDAGIDSMIGTDDAGGMYPAISGAELLVRSEDLERARAALQ